MNAFVLGSFGNVTGSRRLAQSVRSFTSSTNASQPYLGSRGAIGPRIKKPMGISAIPQDLARWRELVKVGVSQADRVLLSEQADILEDFRGPGDLEPIRMEWPPL